MIVEFAWKYIILFTLWATIIFYFFHLMEHWGYQIAFPYEPLGTIGIAVAFYLGFKNSQSYDRFWEGRKIWGSIVNSSRTWGMYTIDFVTNLHATNQVSEEELKAIRQRIIYRHIAWLHGLRLHLRQQSTFSKNYKSRMNKYLSGRPDQAQWDREVAPCLDQKEYEFLIARVNTPAQIIKKQSEEVLKLRERGLIDDFRHMEMMRILEEFYNLQGKCERIKSTPLPRQYAFFGRLFVIIFLILLPVGLVGLFSQMGHSFMWLAIPFNVIISWVFITMELVGDSSEDPFEGYVNDVPMTALSVTIERDLRDMLLETDLPPSTQAVEGVLM